MQTIAPEAIADWVASELFSSERERPVVAITTSFHTHEYFIDPEELEERLEERADVVAIPTGEATWALSEALPPKLDVYGGALRIWWPGLSPESNPYDHKLHVAASRLDADAAVSMLLRALRNRSGAEGGSEAEEEADPVPVEVTAIDRGIEVRDDEGRTGRVTEADVPLHALELCVSTGMQLEATPLNPDAEEGEPLRFSFCGRLPTPWQRVGAVLRPGDVVYGRVSAIQERFALVELLPGARGIVGIADIDHTFVETIGDFVQLDEIVKVVVQSVDEEARRAVLSIKDGRSAKREAGPSPSLVPDGNPFDWHAFLGRPIEETKQAEGDSFERLGSIKRELKASEDDRTLLRETVASLREQVKDLEARCAGLDGGAGVQGDPLEDEDAFLRAVRIAYARDVGEDERHEQPLEPMSVGASFLVSARGLEDVGVPKIVEVAAQVASGRAEELAGREVEPLGKSGPTSKRYAKKRASDDGRAWRCSLQMRSPSARRLLWWAIPSDDGVTIEFAAVAAPDDHEIPE
ncbi:MAG: S1 RNA-binding domain-containing protein [Planctomycetota bacterium]